MRAGPAGLSHLRRWIGDQLGDAHSARSVVHRAAARLGYGKRHHCIISGTGRAGTSFLIQLFTRLGLETGFTPDHLPLNAAARAGLEIDIRRDDAPYIIKNPWLCEHIEEVLGRSDIVIDHAIVPMRSLSAAAQSRIHVERLSRPAHGAGIVPGGLWGTSREDEQELVLLSRFYALLWPLVRHGVPITFLAYPRLVQDPRYLYENLRFLFPKLSFREFRAAWSEVVRPEWVHQFGDDDVPAQARPSSDSESQTLGSSAPSRQRAGRMRMGG